MKRHKVVEGGKEYDIYEYDGSKYWYLNDKLHREDGPAVEHSDGTKSWYLNGKRHREDGPAIECSNGTKYWLLNGKYHREDGPAVEYSDGRVEYWIDDKQWDHLPTQDELNVWRIL